MKQVVEQMITWGHNSTLCSVFIVDATFVCDAPKFISGALLSLSAMIALELPHVNVLTKCDLIDEERVERVLEVESASVLWQREEYNESLKEELLTQGHQPKSSNSKSDLFDPSNALDRQEQMIRRRNKHHRLTEAICSLLDDYSMVSFIPLNITDEDSIDNVLAHIDHTIQYGEDLEVKGADEVDNVGFED